MVGVSGSYKIVVYGGDGRISRVETTGGRLTRGEQRMIIDVLHEPRCSDTFDQLRCESQIRDRSIRVQIIGVQLRLLLAEDAQWRVSVTRDRRRHDGHRDVIELLQCTGNQAASRRRDLDCHFRRVTFQLPLLYEDHCVLFNDIHSLMC